jgi:hypothetical protein
MELTEEQQAALVRLVGVRRNYENDVGSILTAVDVLCDSLKPKPPLTEAVTFYEYEDVQIYWRTWEAPREYPTGRTITILPNPEWDETMRCWRGTYELREES